MTSHWIEEGGVKLKGLVLVCLLLVSLVGLPALTQSASAKPAASSKFVGYIKEPEPIPFPVLVEKPDVNVISLRENFDNLQFGAENNYDTIDIVGCGATSSPGEPTVPAKTIIVLLPPDKDVSNIEVRPGRQVLVEKKLYLYPGQEPTPVGADSPRFTRPNAEVYSSPAPYPSEGLYELEFVTSYRGYKLAVIMLFPVQYIPADCSAIFYPELDVRVKLKPASETGLAFHPTADVDEWVRANVENPELMSSYSSSVSGGEADYLIITRPMFIDALQPLVALKSQRMSVKVVTVDNIVNIYPGRDVPEQIRNCIIDYYNREGTKWVLLAGDADFSDLYNQYEGPNYVLDENWEVPVRYVWNPDGSDHGVKPDYKPTDYYYAGLYGTWDNDNDNCFGEWTSTGDEVDWFADVFVGRMPAQDNLTMQAIVQKTVRYTQDGWENICLFGAYTFKSLKQYIKDDCIFKWMDVYEYYADDGTLSYSAFKNAVNNHNPVLINAAAHGASYGLSVDGSASNTFVNMLTPGDITNEGFSMYAMSCQTNAFDWPGACVGEGMLQDSDGGAIGYVGGARDLFNYGTLTRGAPGQDVKFFEEVFENHEFRQGAALYKSKMDYINSGLCGDLASADERTNLFVTMLLGDPELSILNLENIPPLSKVDPIEPYWHEVPFIITASAAPSIENVALWYRYSNDNSNWDNWRQFDVDGGAPWRWSFTASEGDGYCEFYSIATDVAGNVELAPTKADARCGIDITPPGKPTLQLPENEAAVGTCIPTFGWTVITDDLSGVRSYTLIIDDEPNFEGPFVLEKIDLTGNVYTLNPSEALKNGIYYWRVQAVDDAGNAGNWSEVWCFTVANVYHNPIYIYGDETFTPANGVSDGSGTESDPYIIENWIISAATANGIQIEDTTAYFIVRNCIVENGKYSYHKGISLENVQNGRVENTTTNNNFYIGIYLNYSDNNVVLNNNTTKNGILLADSNYNILTGNTMSGPSRYSIGLTNSNYNMLTGNILSGELDSIILNYSNNNLIYKNYFNNVYYNAYDDNTNSWDNGSAGNYWSDYIGPDNNPQDGIGDVPYPILGGSNQDSHPLMGVGNTRLVLTSPENGSTISDSMPTIRWRKVIDYLDPPVAYKLQVDNENTFTQPLVYSTTEILENHHKLENELAEGTYYWRVRAVDGLGNVGDWSEIWRFTIDTTPSTAPALLSPPNGSSTNDSTPTFEWTSVYDPSGATYTLQYSTNNLLNALTRVEGITGNTYTVPDDKALADNRYYWQVRAVDGAGNVSDWSKVWQFMVDTTLPELISPGNGTAINDATPTLEWSSITHLPSVTYTLQYSTDKEFNSPKVTVIKNIVDDTYTVPDSGALAENTYYWRVRAVYGADNQSNWSEVWRFTVDITPPPAPSLIFPLNGVIVRGNAPLLDWSDVADPSGVTYHLQVTRSNALIHMSYERSGIPSSYYKLENVPENTYYWQVQAVDGAGNVGKWSSMWHFRIRNIIIWP